MLTATVALLFCVWSADSLVNGYLGWLGYKRTHSAADFLVGGREIHPMLMALAYGSTFISTSAIVGFGGQFTESQTQAHAIEHAWSLDWTQFVKHRRGEAEARAAGNFRAALRELGEMMVLLGQAARFHRKATSAG